MRRQQGQGVWDGAMRALWSDYYGATLPLKWAKSIQEGGTARRLGAFTVGLLCGILVFALTLVLCTFDLLLHSNAVAALFFFVAASFVILLLPQRREQAVVWQLPVGACGLGALFFGAILGRLCFTLYGYFALMYANSRMYYNVDPAQRAGAVGDAGRIVFAAEARVDAGRSVGYAAGDGSMYCVAPIVGIGEPRRVDFWAVGVDCCKREGAFHCGAVDDPDARGGAVLFRSPRRGPFGDLLGNRDAFEYYDLAQKKAQTSLGLDDRSEDDVVLVTWMTHQNLVLLSRQYTEKAWVFIVVATFVYAIVSIPFAYVVAKSAVANVHHSDV